MHKQLLQDKKWITISGFIAFLLLSIIPLIFVQPGIVIVGLLFISSLFGLGAYVKDQ
ncbi:hypothetical protein ACVRYP_03015 [Streptococcus rifensis]